MYKLDSCLSRTKSIHNLAWDLGISPGDTIKLTHPITDYDIIMIEVTSSLNPKSYFSGAFISNSIRGNSYGISVTNGESIDGVNSTINNGVFAFTLKSYDSFYVLKAINVYAVARIYGIKLGI